MRKSLFLLLISALLVGACAKTPKTPTNSAEKAFFDAWMKVNYPNLKPTALGAYVIEETEGTGALVGDSEDSKYLRVEVTAYDLNGNVTNTSRKSVAQQIGEYNETYFYGPTMWARVDNSLYAGVDEAVSSMKVGGRKKTIIPGWLFTVNRYDTAEEYVNNITGTNAIYDMEIVEVIDDPVQWELDSMVSYLSHNYPEVSATDSLKWGFYYMQEKAPSDTTTFPNDTTFYINYVGRLLNGQVFDTNIADTAKMYGLYSSSRSYEPTLINYSTELYTDITMGTDGSSVIDGFAYALWKMKSFEKGTCVFHSNLGYKISGSGNSIPGYSPLRFDIEVVDKP